MSADYYIRIWPDSLDEDDMRQMFSNNLGHKFGPSSIADVLNRRTPPIPLDDSRFDLIYGADGVHIGEASFLSAAVTGDAASSIPSPVAMVETIIAHTPEPVVIDEQLITRIKEAMGLTNFTSYSTNLPEVVEEFLRKNIGRRIFNTVE